MAHKYFGRWPFIKKTNVFGPLISDLNSVVSSYTKGGFYYSKNPAGGYLTVSHGGAGWLAGLLTD